MSLIDTVRRLEQRITQLENERPYRYEGQTVIFERPLHIRDRLVFPTKQRSNENGIIGEVMFDEGLQRFYGRRANSWDTF